MGKNMSNHNPFGNIDNTKTNISHLKVWFTAGMGFFTDAYDLFVIGVILVILNKIASPSFPLTAYYESLLASSAIITAVLGQLTFGRIADIVGRKKVYGIEATILAIGALMSAFSPNIYWLLASRFLMGFGIGGDYPMSSTIMSEYSPKKDRGKMVSLVFAFQGIGYGIAVIVGLISVYLFPASIAWRILAGFGAIPPALVIYYRRKIPETPRFSLLVKHDKEEALKAASFVGGNITTTQVKSKNYSITEFLRNYGLLLVGTSLSWFFEDIALYGTGVFSSPITLAILGGSNSLQADVLRAGIPLLIGIPGYFIAAAFMDKIGRKFIQSMGFAIMSILYAVISASIIASGTKIAGFLIPSELAYILFGLTFLFINFGPNTTTFVLPSELYPVRYRTTGHGISAASGKLGAAITTFLFPFLLKFYGLKPILEMLAVISALGFIITVLLVPEPKMKSLEEVSKEKLEVYEKPISA
jgi:PHS family inorganic phosphate transporter-like MFS transporter